MSTHFLDALDSFLENLSFFTATSPYFRTDPIDTASYRGVRFDPINEKILNSTGYKDAAMDDRWLSVEEIARYLGVSRDTIYNWISGGDMPAHRIGRFWKFKKEAVDRWVESGGAGANRTKHPLEGDR